MAANALEGLAPNSQFYSLLVLLASEYERLDQENRSLRARAERDPDPRSARAAACSATALALRARRPPAWEGHQQVDVELLELAPAFRWDAVHTMAPCPSLPTALPVDLPCLDDSPRMFQGLQPTGRWMAAVPGSVTEGAVDMAEESFEESGAIRWKDLSGESRGSSRAGSLARNDAPSANRAVSRMRNDVPTMSRTSNESAGSKMQKRSSRAKSNEFHRSESPGQSGWVRKSYSNLLLSPSGDGSSGPRLSKIFLGTESDEPIQRKPVFANASDMKDRVRAELTKIGYNVTDFYKQTGVWQAIARSCFFEYFTLAVITVNAGWLAFDTDNNDADVLINAPWAHQVVEHVFCTYFTMELFTRFMAFELKRNCLRDPWFVFDLCLVFLTVLETWVMTLVMLATQTQAATTGLGITSLPRVFKLLRLTRMARMARLLRSMPEVMILVKGMVSATRSVFFTLVLLNFVLYSFAIVFRQLLKGTPSEEEWFRSVLGTMHMLWVRGALLDDVNGLVSALEQEGLLYMIMFDLFLLIASLTVMNMLIGVLCEVVSAVATAEREHLAVQFARSKLQRIFDTVLDEDQNSNISKSEFVKIIENKEAVRTMHDLDVDVVGLVDFADIIFAKDLLDDDYERELSFPEFMEVIVAFRGSNTATVKDIENLRKLVCQAIARCESRVQRMEATLSPEARRSASNVSKIANSGSHAEGTLGGFGHIASEDLP